MCCSFGHLAIFITLTVYIQATAPFKNYFQVLCILGFIRTGIGSPIGDALYQHGMTGLMNKYLGANFTPTEAMIATLQELYGYTFVFGIGVLIFLAASRFKRNVKKPIPTLRLLYALIKRKNVLLKK